MGKKFSKFAFLVNKLCHFILIWQENRFKKKWLSKSTKFFVLNFFLLPFLLLNKKNPFGQKGFLLHKKNGNLSDSFLYQIGFKHNSDRFFQNIFQRIPCRCFVLVHKTLVKLDFDARIGGFVKLSA